jgi:methylenetetrahydrofolate reductase (NADPH)
MHIKEILNSHKTSFSFEFSPPRDEKAAELLFGTINDLIRLKPLYVSVTYGAGGSTRELTQNLVTRLTLETKLTVVAHLTCVCSTKQETKKILENHVQNGIENIMALSGDKPKTGSCNEVDPANGFTFASELVAFIKHNFPAIGIGVAGFPEGHPRIPNRLKEIDYLKSKVDAGADYICTQLFFDNHLFYDFCERCAITGINVPIIAGIMPVTSIKGLQRMAELALCTHFPARLLKALTRAEDDEYVEKVGIHWAAEQVRDLIDNNVKGIHFYTFNRSRATLKIYDSLGVSDSERLGM